MQPKRVQALRNAAAGVQPVRTDLRRMMCRPSVRVGLRWVLAGSVALGALACKSSDPRPPVIGPDGELIERGSRNVVPGITVLLTDSIKLVAGKRVGLITNQTGVDEKGRSSVDLLATDPRAIAADVKLVALFSPEHGIRGTEDRTNLPSFRDEQTGLTVHSLYQRSTIAPPDSTLADVEVLVVDLQDIGTRTWTYVGVMLYAMHASGRVDIPVVVLDRPNPLTGRHTEGAVLDNMIADARISTSESPRNGFALWPMPLRHGLTMGEMARMLHEQLKIPTRLHVVPMKNWRRSMWFDDTRLPWVQPSPNLPTLTSALLYPALVPFEATNVSVGRGTEAPFQRVGATWLDAKRVIAELVELDLAGVRFEPDRFTPEQPGDNKFSGITVGGVRIEVVDRDRVQPSRVGAALLWAIGKVHGDSLTVSDRRMDERMGRASVREALLSGVDPDVVMDRQLPGAVEFERDTRRFHLYR